MISDGTPATSPYPAYDDLPGDVIPTRPTSLTDAQDSPEWEPAPLQPPHFPAQTRLFVVVYLLEYHVEEAHRRGVRVVQDYVFNHSSDRHPFFAGARGDPGSPYTPWYKFKDPQNRTYDGFFGYGGNGSPAPGWLSAAWER